MVYRFAATIFVSATLLFACQPVVARMILPVLGGAAAVWIVCSLCFQALVLAGYIYAHVVGSRLPVKTQVVLQLALIGLALVVQPVGVDEALLVALTAKSYSLGVLAVLLRSVGLPFFVLATTSPLVQRWFSVMGEKDPYHLYAASNAGSMLALLGYPFLVEPFLGVLKVRRLDHDAFRVLVFGTTIHGAQRTDPEHRRDPVINFFPTGPAGVLLGPIPGQPGVEAAQLPPRRLGIIGLGIGGLTAYARPGDTWSYFELNPTIVKIARQHFTFLSEMPAGSKSDVEVGDARLRLREGPAARFDVLIMDAFSSDAIPVHLMTRAAMLIYKRAMVPGGLLIAHISNRHMRLEPVVAALAKDAGLHGITRLDGKVSAAEAKAFKSASHWVAMSASPEMLSAISAKNPSWRTLEAPAGQKVWSDDFADLLAAMSF